MNNNFVSTTSTNCNVKGKDQHGLAVFLQGITKYNIRLKGKKWLTKHIGLKSSLCYKISRLPHLHIVQEKQTKNIVGGDTSTVSFTVHLRINKCMVFGKVSTE